MLVTDDSVFLRTLVTGDWWQCIDEDTGNWWQCFLDFHMHINEKLIPWHKVLFGSQIDTVPINFHHSYPEEGEGPIPNAKFPPVSAFLKLAFSPPQCPTRFSRKNFRQDFPKLFSDWLAPHHPIPNDKFPPITAFLKLAFSPPPCPTRFSCKIFLQEFPELDPDWLTPHHPIPNAKFPPITALLHRPTYHKSAKVSPPPFPQILWEPQIN